MKCCMHAIVDQGSQSHLVPFLVTTPQSSGAEDSLSPVKCVDCDRQLSAEEMRHAEDGGEALVCDVCRAAHLRCLQGDDNDDFFDAVSAVTQLSLDVVSKGPQCKLPWCKERAQVESGEYKEFCSKGHYQMFSMLTPSHLSAMPTTSDKSPMSLTGGCM